jgi:hypothetical protein
MVVSDARCDVRLHDSKLALTAPDVIFYAGASLKVDGELNIDTLCVP